jgi:hypothetical protein
VPGGKKRVITIEGDEDVVYNELELEDGTL